MRVLFFNPPAQSQIQRRFGTEYHARGFLLPPYELAMLAGVVSCWHFGECLLLDAMERGLSLSSCRQEIASFAPGLVVTMTGFQHLGDDIAAITTLKQDLPELKTAIFGYLPSHFPKQLLTATAELDYILIGEPELPLSELYIALLAPKAELRNIAGIAYREPGGQITINPPGSAPTLHRLPLPRYPAAGIRPRRYHEPFMPRRLYATYTDRGCRHSCDFCHLTGSKTAYRTRSANGVIGEIAAFDSLQGISTIRFLDENFTANPEHTTKLCRSFIKAQLHTIPWTCLSRLDTLTPELISVMVEAGCRRIYLGVESGSPKILAALGKSLDLGQAAPTIAALAQSPVETSCFFIVGHPLEEEADFKQTLDLCEQLAPDFIIVTPLKPLPGTPLFEQYQDQINFELLPYRCEFKDPALRERAQQREARLLKSFYLTPKTLKAFAKRAARHPRQVAGYAASFLHYLGGGRRNWF